MKTNKILAFVLVLTMIFSLSVSSFAEETGTSHDVVIIGAGGAGLSSAIAAHFAGANVVVLERMALAGGNTSRATAGMNAAETKFQEAEGIEDSVDLFVEETLKGGKDIGNKELVQFMAENSAEAIDWLDGLDITLDGLTTTGGMSVKRTHRPKDGSPIGDFLIGKLLDKCEEFGIQIVYNANATELLVDDANKVVGVKFEKDGKEFQLNAKAVILAAGGFGANLDMVAELKPELTGFVTTNAPGVTGDVIKMAESIGAATVDMDQIQIHPTVEQATSSLITEAVRGDGGILVNQEGKRFTNEMGTRDVVSAAEIAQTGGYAFVIFDEALKEGNKSAAKYIDKGFAKIGNTIEELAEQLNIDPATLAETLNTYNKNLEAGSDPDFGRTTGTALLVKAPYYAIQIAPGIHHTMGGLVINTDTQVLNKDNSAIEALYAAGEITGGIHGANRIGGNAVADIVVFGKQAGTKAAEYALAHGGTGVDNAVAVETGDVEVVGAPTEPGNLKDGTYTATAKANNGDLTVEVVVENGNIITISFPENPETPTIFEAAEAIIVPQIIATQSTEGIDVVASATNSSNAILEAVQQIINENQK